MSDRHATGSGQAPAPRNNLIGVGLFAGGGVLLGSYLIGTGTGSGDHPSGGVTPSSNPSVAQSLAPQTGAIWLPYLPVFWIWLALLVVAIVLAIWVAVQSREYDLPRLGREGRYTCNSLAERVIADSFTLDAVEQKTVDDVVTNVLAETLEYT